MNNQNILSINSNGITFNVKVVLQNDHYGLNNCLTYKGKEPMVEFYDARYAHTDYGQFISRYYITTLLEGNDNRGLCLDGGVPNWNIDEKAMSSVKTWLKNNSELTEIIKSLPPKKPINFNLEDNKAINYKF